MGRGLAATLAALLTLCAFVGCTSGERASDAAAAAVRDSRSAVASLELALRLQQRGSATSEVAKVSLEQTLDAVATAQRDLATANDVDAGRRQVAATAIGTALDALRTLADRDVAGTIPGDLDALQGAEDQLTRAAAELRA